MLEGDVRILGGHPRDYVAPEYAVLQYVRLIDAHQVLAAELCTFEADVRDALDLARAVNHCIHRAQLAILQCLGVFRLAKIHTAGQLTHYQ